MLRMVIDKYMEETIDVINNFNYTLADFIIDKNGYLTIDRTICIDSIENPKSYIPDNFLSNSIINGSVFIFDIDEVNNAIIQNSYIERFIEISGIDTMYDGSFSNIFVGRDVILNSLISTPVNFLSDSIINGDIHLKSVLEFSDGLLSNSIVNGNIYFETELIPKHLLSNTIITGKVYTSSTKKLDFKSTEIDNGYNEKAGYCFFDDILSRVLKVDKKFGYTIYTTPFDYIVEKDGRTAHGKTVKNAIQDIEFKIVAEKLKNEPILSDTELTVKYYRLLTGACDSGIRDWMSRNDIPYTIIDNETVEKEPIKAKDLLQMLEKTNAYGVEKIKSLITFDTKKTWLSKFSNLFFSIFN